MKRREPILIGDLMRQMGIVRADNSVDKDLVCALIYYEQLSEERQRLNQAKRLNHLNQASAIEPLKPSNP